MTGARPNFVKVAPLIRAIKNAQEEGRDMAYSLVYAGSENDKTLEGTLFEDLQMPRPDVYLGVDSHNVNEITSEVTLRFEGYLIRRPTDVVIVVDDLASTMAAAIVAKKLGITLAHLVAGTRSFDITMPKEINRLVIDGLSDYLFTAGSGIGTDADPAKIYVVGNILMDTLRNNYRRFTRPKVMNAKHIDEGKYVVFTINRKALLSNEANLKLMLEAISHEAASMPIIAPLRKEAREVVERLSGGMPNMVFCDPLSYLEFGYLTAHARCIITDSGNVAEEATFNGIPCITLNDYTEHIETIKLGTNVLAGEDAEAIAENLRTIMAGEFKTGSIPDYWDGRTAERILQTLMA